MRRLLVLCYFYPPLAGGGVHRVLGFTRHLPKHGWQCTVVCAGPEDYWVRDESLLARVPEGAEVIRVHGGSALSAWLGVTRAAPGRRSSRTFAWLRRLSDWWLLPDSYVGWARRAEAAAARRLERGGIDAMLSSSPPDSVHLAGLALRRRFALPWVADFRDPWIGLRFREPPSAWHRARQAALERAVLEGADVVLAASRTHAGEIERGSRARRVVHLPNGFEPDDPHPAADPPAAGDASQFRLLYTGTLAQMPDAGTFLDALHDVLARRPEARRRLRARFVGPYESGYEDRSIALGLKGIVEFAGPRSHAESRALQRAADLLLLWKPRDLPTMVPGKLYEYLDSGRPVLAALPAGDEAALLVERAGGERVDPGDRAAFAASLERRYLEWRSGTALQATRAPWLEEHTRAALASRLAGVLDPLAAAKG
ncbi:MAG TPA: glycosyltransferase [Candidatus Eisenbacteria bacterium]|jgi:glycosyltransferase involved in cell wall biosynthesis